MITRLAHPCAALDRNYTRFAALAGVRGDGPTPKGLPKDVSESTKLYSDEWGLDGHGHSFLDLTKATALFLSTDQDRDGWNAQIYEEDIHFHAFSSTIACSCATGDLWLLE